MTRRGVGVFVAASLALGAVGLAGWWWLRESGVEPAQEGGAVEGVAARETLAGDGQRGPALQPPGTRLTWEVASTLTLDFGVLRGGNPGQVGPGAQEVRVTGRWVHTWLPERGGERWLEARLEQPAVTSSSEIPLAQRVEAAQVIQELGRPLYALVTSEGAVREVITPATLHPLARMILKTLIARVQIVVPPGTPPGGRPSDAWTVIEQDLGGELSARYMSLPDGSLRKVRERYTWIATPEGQQDPAGLGEWLFTGQTTLKLDAEGAFAQVTVDEGLTIQLPSANLKLHAEEDTTLRQTRREVVPLEGLPDPTTLEGVERGPLPGVEDLLGYQRRRAAQPGPTPPARAGLDLLRSAGDDSARRFSGLLNLAAILKARPDDAREVLLAARAQGEARLEGAALDAALGALADAGTPQAQAALLELGRDATLPGAVRVNAINSLSLVPAPDEHTARALVELVEATGEPVDEDVRGAATLALGTVAGRRRAAGAADRPDPLELLAARLQTAKTPEEQALLLEALGATRDARALPHLKAGLRAPEGGVRAVAAGALRFIPGAEPEVLLLALIERDPEPAVRASALDALGYRPDIAPALGILGSLLPAEPAAPVRLAGVALLERIGRRGAPVKPLLERLAQHDPEPAVRDAALRALKG